MSNLNEEEQPIIHIEGHSELIRCPSTGAVINNAQSEYNKFVVKRKKEKEQENKIKNLENTVDTLTTQLEDISEMLKMMMKQAGLK